MENNASHPKEKSIIPESILDDLASRFIINIPFYERFNFVRICFQIELAHWFYLDFFCTGEEVPQVLVPCGIKQFASHIFNVRRFYSALSSIFCELFFFFLFTFPFAACTFPVPASTKLRCYFTRVEEL